jgi:hypothetical protein
VDSFNYLAVLLSIVLGLAIMQVLQGFRGLILTRARVKLYLPTLTWAGLALLIAIQGWWASFSMRTHGKWTFAALLVIMMQAISVYMVAALVLPDVAGDAIVDLREHYFAHRPWFFGAIVSVTLFSLAKDLVLYGRLPRPIDTGFQVIFGLAAVAAAFLRNEWFHQLLGPVLACLFLVYIALLFARL